MAAAMQSAFLTSSASLSFSEAVSSSGRLSAPSSVQTSTVKNAGLIRAEGVGTKIARKVKVVDILGSDKTGTVRTKLSSDTQGVKLLSRVQELRLLSKAEEAGLLSLAESFGLSLGTIEKLGLLSKAESFGVLSAASNKKTPGTLLTVALFLLVAGPAAVYLIPEDSTAEVVLQIVLATLFAVGGAAAFGGSKLVKSLQS
eukprot:jgi/Mesen1/9718/ME000693S09271